MTNEEMPHKAALPISEFQDRFFIEWALSPHETIYNVAIANKISGNLNCKIFKQSVCTVVEQNEILYAQYSDDGAHCFRGAFEIDDFYHAYLLDESQSIHLHLQSVLSIPFDLRQGPLLLFYLIAYKCEYYFVLLAHHIIADYFTGAQLIRQISDTYNALSSDRLVAKNVDRTFTRAVEAEQANINSVYKEKAREYWLNFIADIPLKVNLPYRRSLFLESQVDFVDDKAGAHISFELTASQSVQLRAFAQQKGATVFVVISAIYGFILSRYCNLDKLMLSFPVNMRQPKYNNVGGCFVNNIPLKFELDGLDSLEDLIESIKKQRKSAKQFQGYSLTNIIQDQRKYRNIDVGEVFNVAISQTDLSTLSLDLEDLTISPISVNCSEMVLNEMELLYDASSFDTIKFRFEYRKNLFDAEFIHRFVNSFKKIIADVVSGQDVRIKTYTVLDQEEFRRIVYHWNATNEDYPKVKTLPILFEEAVALFPNDIAVVYQSQQITYKELNEQSNRIASYIRTQYHLKTARALSPDCIIALFLDTGLEMIVGILAVLKAGAAYVPMDINYPQERIDYLLADTDAKLVLCRKQPGEITGAKLPPDSIVYIDAEVGPCDGECYTNLPAYSNSGDLAYVIYTSGTTGKPKGVMVEHRSVVNLITGLIRKYAISPGERFLLFANYVFDASVEQIWLSLSSGGTLYIIGKEVISGSDSFIDYVTGNSITHLDSTPSFLSTIDPTKFLKVKRVVFGAEYLSEKLYNRYKAVVPVVINAYGPTEATVTALLSVNSHYLSKATIPNTKAYVLDSNQMPVPVGSVGELYLGGAGLARGYRNLPGLTKERFIANPFATDADVSAGYGRLYRTGDMASWLPDGNLIFVGRNDDQVKIRGYRIELGEIEAALSLISGLQQSCVLVQQRKTGNDGYLVVYYVLEDEVTGPDQSAIQQCLSQVLPEYMVPAVYVKLASMPLTITGKLDKSALPDVDLRSSSDEYAPPITTTEKIVCEIWQEVIGLDRVGITDDFFRIGGNSILAIVVTHRMTALLNCDLQVADVFRHKTISQILAHIPNRVKIDIPRATVSQPLLSFAQERLWFIEQYAQGTSAYHIPLVFELKSGTQVAGIEHAIQQIVHRHDVLRSTIEETENQTNTYLKVHHAPLVIEQVTLYDEDEYRTLLKEDINAPFNLSIAYPIRVKFYVIISPDELKCSTFLLVNFHHIAADGWSMDIFHRELLYGYQAYIGSSTVDRPAPLEIQYKDYAQWQRSVLNEDSLKVQLTYWKNKLSGSQNLMLPTDYPRPAALNYKGSNEVFGLNKETEILLRELARFYGTTLHSVLLSSVAILLGKYSGQQDIVTGSPIANRHYRQTEGLIGFFVNIQVQRTFLRDDQTYADLIAEVHKEQIDAQLHQDLPFEKLVSEMEIARNGSMHPIFQVIFDVQSAVRKDVHDSALQAILTPIDIMDIYDVEKFDLSIIFEDHGNELIGRIGYATSLFNKDTVARFIEHYTHLLGQLVKAPDRPYSQHSLLKSKEYNKIVFQWNLTDRSYGALNSIVDMFEAQVAKVPHDIAIVFEGKHLTYQQVNERSDRLARHLKAHYEIVPNDIIGFMLRMSDDMLITILGILKAGAAYVCLSPDYPDARKKYIIEDTALKVLIVHDSFTGKLDFYDGNLFVLDAAWDSVNSSVVPPGTVITSGDLAYVIYTSGTTGNPKGVLIEHRSVLNYIHNIREILLPDIVNVDFSTNIAFDLTVTTTIGALLLGKRIFIYSGELTDVIGYAQHLIRNKIEFIKSTPSLLASLPPESFADYKIKQAFVGGEKLEEYQLGLLLKFVDTVIDEYGPTEATVGTTFINKKMGRYKCIGKPYCNYKVYILDSNRIPVPIGVIGELYIGGEGVARGYLNRAELTEQRFLPNPFATGADRAKNNVRLYKTGDLVKWLPDGNLEFVGRNDEQIKIRGYRVELGEIEEALSRIAGIRQCCVLAKERRTELGNYKHLVGYYVLDNNNSLPLSQTTILTELSLILPAYVFPITLVEMRSMPLTSNGKIDKQAFPDPGENSLQKEYVTPKNKIEIELCNIWQRVLGLEQISTNDNFFEIGGNSILSIRLSNSIRRAGYNCLVKDVFEYKTIHMLAQYLATRKGAAIIQPEQGILTGSCGMSPIQKWFVEKNGSKSFGQPDYYNQGFLIKTAQLDEESLQRIVKLIVDYHDILRVKFTGEENAGIPEEDLEIDWRQTYQGNEIHYEIESLDIQAYSVNEIDKVLLDLQNSLNAQGPLFSVSYLYGYANGEAMIYFCIHRLLVDKISWHILAEHVRILSSGGDLPPKCNSFRQWAAYVKDYALRYPHELHWWRKQLDGLPPVIEGQQKTSTVVFTLSSRLTSSLLQNASKAYFSEINDILLTALAYALREMDHSDTQFITIIKQCRENPYEGLDISRTMGWFSSIFPSKLELKSSYRESIQWIKEYLRNIPNMGIGFGAFATGTEAPFAFTDLPGVSYTCIDECEMQKGDWTNCRAGSIGNAHWPYFNSSLVDISGFIVDSRLTFNVTTRISDDFTKKLAAAYKTAIKNIDRHCNAQYQKNGSSYTPGDFKEYIPYEIINDHLTEAPIFILPPGRGGAESFYANLVPELKDKKVVLFNNYIHFIEEKRIDSSEYTIERLADYYKGLIQKLQPTGVYTLVGWSFGGILAFEICMQLQNSGYQIDKLLILDSYFGVKHARIPVPDEIQKIARRNINYRYNPKYESVKFDIILFKASHADPTWELEPHLDHYAREVVRMTVKHYLATTYNGLDRLFANNFNSVVDRIKIVKVNCHHRNVPSVICKDIGQYV